MRLHHLIPLALMILLFFSCKKDKNIITLEAQTFEVLESISDAEKIGKIVATSSEGTPLTFKLIENSDDLFIVDSDGSFGIATGKRFNFNTAASHQIIVEATDGTKSVTSPITIKLVSVLLALEAQTFEVLETVTDQEEIGKITATSSSGNPLSFELIDNPDGLFYVNPDGAYGLATGKRLNFKTAASHQIVVEVTDGFKTVSNTITINVIDVVEPFITTWKTDNNGLSDDNQVTISTNPDETYHYTVDWGDGSKDSLLTGDIIHTYASPGTYTVSITGTFPQASNFRGGDNEKLLTVEQWGDNQWKSMNLAFYRCKNLSINAIDAPDLSQVTSTSQMFGEAKTMNSDLSHWDVSNVTDMSDMFQNAILFNGDLSSWDVSNVTNMADMFYGAQAFNQDLNEWDVSNVKNMSRMFGVARAFNGNISNWDVSNVANMTFMFWETHTFNGDISNWEVSNVKYFIRTFQNAKVFNGDISTWDVSEANNMKDMFYGAQAFDKNLGNWDISNVTDMTDMFKDSGLSMENYDALLLGWSKLKVQDAVILGVGNTNYSNFGVASRAILTVNYNWTITDGGLDD